MTGPYFGQADATRIPLADDSVNLIMTSPPYMDARTYGINAQRGCEDWITWMLDVVKESLRVCAGATIVNCAGVTRKRCYWPGPEGLLYRAWQQGIECYRPVYWHRVGIPGSGGDDWFRADVEYCLCFKRAGKLPWSDNTACGSPPKYDVGGLPTHRDAKGNRLGWKKTPAGGRNSDGSTKYLEGWAQRRGFIQPELSNPGCLFKTIVGGGVMGHSAAHESEAPFPEKLVEFFVKSLCPPGGRVLDPFSGSGTTTSVATRLGRIGIGFDVRMNQCELGRRRCANVQREMFVGGR